MKRVALLLTLGVAVAGISAFSAFPRSVSAPPQNENVVRIGNLVIPVEIADSADEWARGLSGRAVLPQNHGMLFVFEQPDRYGFWMPDMRFPIDIIWIGPDRRIVDIAENIAPESYPKRFYPSSPAQYVLEVNANFAAMYTIKIGDSVILP